MNLRVDLILPSEQRSGSAVNVKSLTRMASVIVPVAALILASWAGVKVMSVNAELSRLQLEWDAAEKQEKTGEKLKTTVQNNKAIQAELEGWRASRLDWHHELYLLMKSTPSNIQLTNVGVKNTTKINELDKLPSRNFSLTLSGKTSGRSAAEAENNVQILRRSLSRNPQIKEASVALFTQDKASDAGPFDRVFTIECYYKPRLFQ